MKRKSSFHKVENDSLRYSSKIRKNSYKLVNNPNQIDLSLYVKRKIMGVNFKIEKIEKALSQEIITQMSDFHERKRNMKIGNFKTINSTPDNSPNSKRKRSIRGSRGSSLHSNNSKKLELEEMQILESIEKMILDTDEDKNKNKSKENNNGNNDNDVINTPQKTSGAKTSYQSTINEILNEEEWSGEEENLEEASKLVGQTPMLKEIEEFVKKNMDEMYKSIDELKANFEDEIKEAEENGFPDIANGLKEDLEAEIDNLKDQYEEKQRRETEKIRRKYSVINRGK